MEGLLLFAYTEVYFTFRASGSINNIALPLLTFICSTMTNKE